MANASAVASPAQGGPVLSTPLISVVDDDASVRAATENLLKSRGYVVQTFASAEEFLRSPRLNETSCVITDVQMPVMSGLDLLAEMRTRGYGVPFIFITAFPNDRVRASALSAGAAGFLAKPFAGHTLIEYLDAALEENGGGGDT
ncbi:MULTISPECIES: response regulator transcription factor [Bradyrhizobium]|nr:MULTISPECIES: response regulator [Bradyrhizobium]QOZ23647.1 response regulator [Bradyrhizobium sp. CCBAU 51753]